MAVVDQRTGKQLGVVRDIYVDASWRLKGLIIENKGLFRSARCIPLEQLTIGEDAVYGGRRIGHPPTARGHVHFVQW